MNADCGADSTLHFFFCSRQALRMLFGLDLVVVQGRNVSVNGMEVLEGEPRLQKGEVPSGWGESL